MSVNNTDNINTNNVTAIPTLEFDRQQHFSDTQNQSRYDISTRIIKLINVTFNSISLDFCYKLMKHKLYHVSDLQRFKISLTSSNSSGLYKFGTSPLLRMLLISSRKPSSTTWMSLKRKTVGLFSTPAWKYSFFRSERNTQAEE